MSPTTETRCATRDAQRCASQVGSRTGLDRLFGRVIGYRVGRSMHPKRWGFESLERYRFSHTDQTYDISSNLSPEAVGWGLKEVISYALEEVR
jgi:hypothetical protein